MPYTGVGLDVRHCPGLVMPASWTCTLVVAESVSGVWACSVQQPTAVHKCHGLMREALTWQSSMGMVGALILQVFSRQAVVQAGVWVDGQPVCCCVPACLRRGC